MSTTEPLRDVEKPTAPLGHPTESTSKDSEADTGTCEEVHPVTTAHSQGALSSTEPLVELPTWKFTLILIALCITVLCMALVIF